MRRVPFPAAVEREVRIGNSTRAKKLISALGGDQAHQAIERLAMELFPEAYRAPAPGFAPALAVVSSGQVAAEERRRQGTMTSLREVLAGVAQPEKPEEKQPEEVLPPLDYPNSKYLEAIKPVLERSRTGWVVPEARLSEATEAVWSHLYRKVMGPGGSGVMNEIPTAWSVLRTLRTEGLLPPGLTPRAAMSRLRRIDPSRLARARWERDLSQAEVASSLAELLPGYSAKNYPSWENREGMVISGERAEALSLILDVPLAWLYGEGPDEVPEPEFPAKPEAKQLTDDAQAEADHTLMDEIAEVEFGASLDDDDETNYYADEEERRPSPEVVTETLKMLRGLRPALEDYALEEEEPNPEQWLSEIISAAAKLQLWLGRDGLQAGDRELIRELEAQLERQRKINQLQADLIKTLQG